MNQRNTDLRTTKDPTFIPKSVYLYTVSDQCSEDDPCSVKVLVKILQLLKIVVVWNTRTNRNTGLNVQDTVWIITSSAQYVLGLHFPRHLKILII